MTAEVELAEAQLVLRPGEPAAVAYTDVDYAISNQTARLLLHATPANTQLAYDRAWSQFTGWCTTAGRTALPATAQTLADYVVRLIGADLAPATVDQAIGTIRSRHRDAGHREQPDTTAALKLLRAYRRDWADAGGRVRKAKPLLLDALRATVGTCDPGTARDARDRLLLLLGFNLMARRSELAALDLADLTVVDEGLTVFIRRSKTDQGAVGAEVHVPFGQHIETCAVRAAAVWRELLGERGLTGGALLRPVDRHGRLGGERGYTGRPAVRLTGKSVGKVVRRRALLADLQDAEDYTGHSLRSGGATAAYAADVPVSVIAAHGRWSEKSPVVLAYIRAVDKWRNNAMKGIGL